VGSAAGAAGAILESMSRRIRFQRFKVGKPSSDALAAYWRNYPGQTLHFAPDALPPISSEALFGNDKPLALDLGGGRGEFVVAQAQERSGVNFVGIEWHGKSMWDAVNRAQQAGVANARFVQADLRLALAKVPDESVSEAYLLFPPTAAIRHSKHRGDLLSETMVAAIHRVLEPGAAFRFVTDHADYFEWKCARIADSGLFEIEIVARGFEGGQTRFQTFWESFGIESRRLECRKKPYAGTSRKGGQG
jgi:tRNA (guanine-N7-)-methyltransferase